MKKKFLLVLLTFILVLSNCNLSCYAKNKKGKKDKHDISQLADYVIGGSGTQNDPYIVDDACPYKEVMDEHVQEICDPSSEINSENELISTVSKCYIGTRIVNSRSILSPLVLYDYNGALTIYWGTAPNGAEYNGTRSIPSLTSNGNLWIQRINYVTPDEVVALYTQLSSVSTIRIVNSALALGIRGKSLYDYLVTRIVKIGAVTASALAKANAVIFWTTAPGRGISFIYAQKDLKPLVNNHKGLLRIQFAITYNGSWYQSETEATWSTCTFKNAAYTNNVYKPNKIYGDGDVKRINI